MTAVLTALGGSLEARVAVALGASSTCTLARRCADLADLLAAAEAGAGAAAVVGSGLRGLDLSAVAALRQSGLRVVAVIGAGGGSSRETEAQERVLRQLGVDAVVVAELTDPSQDREAALRAALESALAEPRPPTASTAVPGPEQGSASAHQEGMPARGAGASGRREDPGADDPGTPAPRPQAPGAGGSAADGLDGGRSGGDEPVVRGPAVHGRAGDGSAGDGSVAESPGVDDGGADDPAEDAADDDPGAPWPVSAAASGDDDLIDGTDARGHEGTVLVVWGPVGAPGRTTVAVNLATEAARAGRSVLLIDLDTRGAAIAQLLAVLDEAPGIAAATRASEQGVLDVAALARVAPLVEPDLRVLTGLPRADRWHEVRPAAVTRVLQVARSLADLVVLDIGAELEDDDELSYDTLAPRRNGAALAALEDADLVLVIGAADPVGLQRLVRGVEQLRGHLGERLRTDPLLVVNRLRESAVGPQPARRVREALARFASIDVLELLPDDPASCDRSVLEGRALADVAPRSPLRRAVIQLLDRLGAHLPDGGVNAGLPGGKGGGKGGAADIPGRATMTR